MAGNRRPSTVKTDGERVQHLAPLERRHVRADRARLRIVEADPHQEIAHGQRTQHAATPRLAGNDARVPVVGLVQGRADHLERAQQVRAGLADHQEVAEVHASKPSPTPSTNASAAASVGAS